MVLIAGYSISDVLDRWRIIKLSFYNHDKIIIIKKNHFYFKVKADNKNRLLTFWIWWQI